MSLEKSTGRRWIVDSIQSRLTILLLTALAPVLLVHSFSHYKRLQSQIADQVETNKEVARAVARIFEGYMNEILRQELAIGTSFTAVEQQSVEKVARILEVCSKESPVVHSFNWVDPQGQILASSDTHVIGLNVAHRKYFQDIVAGRSWTISNLFPSAASERLLFTIARGIRDVQGVLLGVVVAAMPPESLRELLAIERQGSSSISVIDGEGRTVFRYPTMEWTWEKREYTRNYSVTWEALSGKEISASVQGYSSEGERIVALAPISGAGWVASAGCPRREVIAPVLDDFLSQTGLLLMACVLAFLLALGFSRSIARPVKKLREYAMALGLDEMQEPIELRGVIELEDLGKAFNRAEEQVRRRDMERIGYLERLKKLIEVSRDVMAESTVQGLLNRICDTARSLTGARLALAGHTVDDGAFELFSVSGTASVPPCSGAEKSDGDKPELCCRLFKIPGVLRLTDEQVRSHPAFRDLNERLMPLRGLIAGQLGGQDKRAAFMVMASCKDDGDFTVFDETLFAQLLAIASLALKHIEAREDALKRACEIEAIMDQVPAVVWIAKDPECRVITGSRTSYELLNITPGTNVSYSALEGTVSSHIRYFKNGEQLRADELPLQVSASRGIALKDCELDLVLENGKVQSLLGNSVPIRNDRGEVTGALAAFADITELKHAGEELRRSRDELEMRVRERTAELELANEKLRAVPARLIAVQEEERKRLAGELHDSIGQTLAAIKFGIETVMNARDQGNTSQAFEILDRFVPILQRSIDETRSIYMGLRPKTLEEMGLLLTLEWFCREFHKLYPKHHIELMLEIEEEEIPDPLQITVFRIVQEALNNISRHSRAEWVDLRLVGNEQGIELIIADDGIGMDVDYILQADTARSLGLTSMRERAEFTGGSFSIQSTPGEGATIKVFWSSDATISL